MIPSVEAQHTQSVGLADEANPTTSIQEARTTPEIIKSTAQRQASLADDAQRMQNAGKDLKRLETQSDSTLAKLGYTALRGIHWFGTNFVDQFRGEPFKELRGDLDRSAKQTDSAVAKRALQGLGIFYAAGSHAFKLPSTLAEGTAACAADLAGAIRSIPDAIQHNGDVTFAGGREFLKGNVSEGTAMICEGSTGNAMIAGAALGIIEGVPKVYTTYAEGLNGALNAAAKYRPTSFNADPFDIAARNSMEFGGIRLPKAISEWLGLEDYQKLGPIGPNRIADPVERAKFKTRVRAGDFRNQDASYQLFKELNGKEGTEMRSSFIMDETLVLSPERLSQLPDGTVVWDISNGTRVIKGTDFQSADIPNMQTFNGMTFYGLRPRPRHK